jgi:hypothetical protein
MEGLSEEPSRTKYTARICLAAEEVCIPHAWQLRVSGTRLFKREGVGRVVEGERQNRVKCHRPLPMSHAPAPQFKKFLTPTASGMGQRDVEESRQTGRESTHRAWQGKTLQGCYVEMKEGVRIAGTLRHIMLSKRVEQLIHITQPMTQGMMDCTLPC